MNTETFTFGQRLAGVSFNPSKDANVDRLKALFAEAADIVQNHQQKTDKEVDYLYNLVKGNALREILNAQMNAVKLVTLQY